MTCDITDDAKGNPMLFMCSRGKRHKKCADCGRPATLLCDYKLRGKKEGKTCDRPLCRACAVNAGRIPEITGGMRSSDTVDYCKAHAELMKKEATP